jgi:hypothetical protein
MTRREQQRLRDLERAVDHLSELVDHHAAIAEIAMQRVHDLANQLTVLLNPLPSTPPAVDLA